MSLPGRLPAEEDAFVARFRDDGAEDLVEAIAEAVAERRLVLAARLVGLLDGESDEPAVERARRATHLLLHQGLGPEDVSWCALDDAWRDARRQKVQAAKDRQRRVLNGTAPRPGRRRR